MKPQIKILTEDCRYNIVYEGVKGDCDHVDGPEMCDISKCPIDLSKSSVALIIQYHPKGDVEMIRLGLVEGGHQTQIIMRSDKAYKIILEEVDK